MRSFWKGLRADIGENKFSSLFNELTEISVLKWLVCPSYTSETLKKSNYISWAGRTWTFEACNRIWIIFHFI